MGTDDNWAGEKYVEEISPSTEVVRIMRAVKLERVKGIEPSYAAWEAAVLPLNYTRVVSLPARMLLDFGG